MLHCQLNHSMFAVLVVSLGEPIILSCSDHFSLPPLMLRKPYSILPKRYIRKIFGAVIHSLRY